MREFLREWIGRRDPILPIDVLSCLLLRAKPRRHRSAVRVGETGFGIVVTDVDQRAFRERLLPFAVAPVALRLPRFPLAVVAAAEPPFSIWASSSSFC